MKKIWRIIFSIIIGIVLVLVIDFIGIRIWNRPVFAIRGDNSYEYKGLFYNTYNCPWYPMVQIKFKGSKFRCVESNSLSKEVVDIVDKTKEMDDFMCAEALEEFYEDLRYKYYYSCMKSKYIVVRYNDGTEKRVEDALKEGIIKITDLDLFDIKYYKEEKD